MSQNNFPHEGSHLNGQDANGGFPAAPQPGAPQHDYSQQGMPAAPAGYTQAPVAVGAAPKEHSLSVKLIIASIVLGLIGALLTFMNLDAIVDESIRQAQAKGQDMSGMDRNTIKSFTTGSLIGGLVLSVVLQGLLAFFWAKGHNWARIVLTILAVFSLFGLFSSFAALSGPQMLSSILGILGTILFLAGVFLAWNKNVSAWINARKLAKLNGQTL